MRNDAVDKLLQDARLVQSVLVYQCGSRRRKDKRQVRRIMSKMVKCIAHNRDRIEWR